MKLTALAPAALIIAALATTASNPASAQVRNPAYNWSGFYVGVNGGYGWGHGEMSALPNDEAAKVLFAGNGFGGTQNPGAKLHADGGFGGGQVGYMWQQTPQWVSGIEADFQGGNVKSNSSSIHYIAAPPAFPITTVANTELRWFGTLRGRIGYLATPSMMLFGTAGVAVGGIEQSATHAYGVGFGATINAPPNVGYRCFATGEVCFAGSRTSAQLGVTAGAGAEWMVTSNVSLKAEYTYLYFGKSHANAVALNSNGQPVAASTRVSSDIQYHLARLGLNWHFQ